MTTQHVLNEQMKYWAERSAASDRQAEISALLAAATVAAAGTATAAATTTTAPTATAAAAVATATTAATTTAAADTTATTDAAAAANNDAAAAAAPPAHLIPSPAVRERRFKEWLLHFESNRFYAWAGHSDNATHFKSGKMFHYWSNRSTDVEFLKMVWINFGCPGHGKGPWDGFGAVVKTQVRNSKAPVSTPMEH